MVLELHMAAAARKAINSLVHLLSLHRWKRVEVNRPEQHDHRVGEYYADYSEPSRVQLVAPQAELDELLRESSTVSVKRES